MPLDYTGFNMGIDIIDTPITRNRLRDIAARQFGDFVKAVVDVERGLMAIGGDLHADEESTLLDAGSDQRNLWGINLYPDLPPDQWVEFDSMINVRPSESNRSREVENPLIREKPPRPRLAKEREYLLNGAATPPFPRRGISPSNAHGKCPNSRRRSMTADNHPKRRYCRRS